jgi:hypothetical protein
MKFLSSHVLHPIHCRYSGGNDHELSHFNAKDRKDSARIQNRSSQEPSADTLWLQSEDTDN